MARITLGALLKPEARPRIPAQEVFCFCKTASCEVVYFCDGQALFRKDDLARPVGLKEPGDSTAPVCYCFGWTPQKIRAEIEATGKSTAIEQIKAQVKAGNCYCEVTNPQGSCCLGNVAKTVQDAVASSGTRS
ncbi:MAG: (2Fe-2S)-binding protein [Candidatus Omnitrophica bacterium]|nr:(2Fe-2S)-binding protein [Candidatus Omnitrophota bacterium]